MDWRKPHTMPEDGTHVLCAYRWSEKDILRVTIGHWFKGDEHPGVISAPDGAYIPCVGWLPMPGGEHEPFMPLHLRYTPTPLQEAEKA